MKIRSILLIASIVISGASAVALHGYDFSAGTAQIEFVTYQLSSAFDAALAHQGGAEAVGQRKTNYDSAVSAGIPLADAGLSEKEFSDLSRQGSNVVVPCSVASPSGSEINALLAQAGETSIPCGGFNPDLPRASATSYRS